MQRRTAPRHLTAFTLTEVIAAIALLALLVTAVAALITDLRVRHDAVLNTAAASRAADTLFETLETDLLTTFVADRNGRPGITGDATSITIRSRRATVTLEAGTDPRSGTVTTRFRFDPAANELLAARTTAAGSLDAQRMSDRFAHLRFRYHDGERWRTAFDSAEAGALPILVEATLIFAPIRDIEDSANGSGPPPPPTTRTSTDPFADWLNTGRRRVFAIPDAAPLEPDAPGVSVTRAGDRPASNTR